MKAEIIHDPTRGWLLLTEMWPEKPEPFNHESGGVCPVCRYERDLDSCLSTAIEIQREDWDEVIKAVKIREVGLGNEEWPIQIQDHHPYSVDAEFEVVTQQLRSDKWKPKEIARLVKAKEDEYDITVKPVYQSTHKIVATKAKPTESQDELWDEVMDIATDKYWRQGYSCPEEELRAKFRIERI